MTASQMLSPNSLWERLRNPLSGWARTTLILVLPFVIWTHNPLLILLMLLALASHPFWFPPVRGRSDDIMTRAVDGTREWLRTTQLYERTLVYYSSIVLFGSSVVLLWERHWMGALLYICMLGFKIIAIAMIFEKLDNISYSETETPAPKRKAVFDDEDV